jgi:hypothetical protein
MQPLPTLRRLFLTICILLTISTCALPLPKPDPQFQCSAAGDWLPTTPPPTNQTPPPHPAPDCPFYQAAWPHFLYATQLEPNGRPRFLAYSTIADLFGAAAAPQFAKQQAGMLSLAPRNLERPNDKQSPSGSMPPAIDGGVTQAGPLRGLLIDQNGNPIFYAIHVNETFANFVHQSGLTTQKALLGADPEKLEFPEGAVELKSAWQIVDAARPPSNYFTTRATIPRLRVSNGQLTVDTATREVTVALIAIHVVFVLKDHPEFVWSTFEHIAANGMRDNAPAAAGNPSAIQPSTVISDSSWPLFKAGTTAGAANTPNSSQERLDAFDEQAQRFTRGGKVLQASVYRMFPASASNTTSEDEDVTSVNKSMRSAFGRATVKSGDKRGNYQLVGAIWLDNPGRDFKSNVLFQNKDGQTVDDPGAMVAGEDRLSSTAMESFTQGEDGRPNCFSCHNTKRVSDDITGATIIPAKRLNVSHVISKFLSELQ